ncbi:MAG: peptidyl-dipeptidase Dcp, partial [Yoonia sp.]
MQRRISMTNPLLAEWNTPFGLPPFDQISDDDYKPAVEAALDQSRANIAAIADDPAEPDFANTVEALELADVTLGRVLSAFYSVAGADSNRAREALQREFAPMLSAYSSEVSENKALFARVQAVWDKR